MDYIRKKKDFEVELEETKKCASEKTWSLIAKASSFEVKLNAVKEKKLLLKGSSPWSSEKARYHWDWSKKFLKLRRQLQDTKAWHNNYRVCWAEKISKLERELKEARDEVTHLQR